MITVVEFTSFQIIGNNFAAYSGYLQAFDNNKYRMNSCAFSGTPLYLDKDFILNISMKRISQGIHIEGFAFVLGASKTYACLGPNSSLGFNGVQNAVIVELDMHCNPSDTDVRLRIGDCLTSSCSNIQSNTFVAGSVSN